MRGERGNIGIYLLFSLAAAGAVGYGVFRVMRTHRLAAEAAAAAAPPPRNEPRPAAVPEPPAEPAEPPEVTPTVEAAPDDLAERDAIESTVSGIPDHDAVLFGTPGVAGQLPPAMIENVVKQFTARYQRCYRKLAPSARGERATLQLTIMIGADGNVSDVTFAPTALDESLTTCVVATVRKLHFGRPADGRAVKVVYPITFAPAAPSEGSTDCDEVACVLENYERPCCARFQR